jgi:hypothetical protein
MEFSQNGYTFTDEIWTVKELNDYCKRRKVNASVFIATKENGFKTFVIFDEKGIPVFEDQQYEGIAVHIDIMALDREFG